MKINQQGFYKSVANNCFIVFNCVGIASASSKKAIVEQCLHFTIADTVNVNLYNACDASSPI